MTTGTVPWGARLAQGTADASVDFSLVCTIEPRGPQDTDKENGVERLFLDATTLRFYYHSGVLADAWRPVTATLPPR